MEEKEFTITVFTENFVGLLNRITIIFTRRHINIESLTVSASEIKGIHRFTIVVSVTEEVIKKVVKQIQKNVDVIKATYYQQEEIIYQEIALYKVPTKALAQGSNVEEIIRTTSARVLTVEPEYVIIEKTGQKEETQALFKQLEPFGILQFVRSGRVAITKEIKELYNYLKEVEGQSAYSVINQN